MQQIMVSIDNKELEQSLAEEADKKGRQLASIILEVLEKTFLRKKSPELSYRKLNPLEHMSKIEYEIDETDELSGASPFEGVKDSAAHVRK